MRAAETAASRRKPTDGLTAYDLLRQGVAHKHVFDRERNLLARDLLRRATEADPGYAEAWAYRGFDLLVGWMLELTGPQRSGALDEALELVGRARRLDPSLPIAHQALSQIYAMRGQYPEALEAGRRAVELAPSDAENWIVYADPLAATGRYGESIAASSRALRLNPIPPAYYHGIAAPPLFLANRLEEAVRTLRPCLDQPPGHSNRHILLALAEAEPGRLADARADLARLATAFPTVRLELWLDPSRGWTPAELARIWGGLGRLGVARPAPAAAGGGGAG